MLGQFWPPKRVQRGLVVEFSSTQGPVRCGKVATTQAGGTWHLPKDSKSCSSGSSKSSKLNPFHAIFSQFSTRNGKIFSTQGPIRCGQVAITQAGGTWHLQSPNIGQILFPCTLKIKQIWPISCQFCRFSTQKGIQRGLVENLYATQGLIRGRQVATTQTGSTWHLQPHTGLHQFQMPLEYDISDFLIFCSNYTGKSGERKKSVFWVTKQSAQPIRPPWLDCLC